MSNNSQILTINTGSSSLKLLVFEASETFVPRIRITIDGLGLPSSKLELTTYDGDPQTLSKRCGSLDHVHALHAALGELDERSILNAVAAVGYRVVFGGPHLRSSQLINEDVLRQLESYAQFDPDHMPFTIQIIKLLQERFSGQAHVACFDTAFFSQLPSVAQTLPLPKSIRDKGVLKYGYHGLSYTYLLSRLEELGTVQDKKIILAHLGSGASLAAVKNGQPIDTTMSFSPTSGIPMSSRSGDLDPSIASFLIKQEGMDIENFAYMTNRESGLLGISETTADMYSLLQQEDNDPRSKAAVNSFCYHVRKAIGALSASLNGLDLIVFSGGIGEQSAPIRARVCEGLSYLGVEVDSEKNNQNSEIISKEGTITIRVLHTEEEQIIARDSARFI
jgi:acetate kinase